MKPTKLFLAVGILATAAFGLHLGTAQTIDTGEARVIDGETPQAGPGVPEPPRVTQTEIVTPTSSTVRTESVTPARLQSKSIVDSQGATVATVERVIDDPETGKVRFLVVSDLEHRYIVPFEAFTVANSDGDLTVRLNADAHKLAGAPQFQESRVLEYSTQATSEPIYAYWSVQHQREAKTK